MPGVALASRRAENRHGDQSGSISQLGDMAETGRRMQSLMNGSDVEHEGSACASKGANAILYGVDSDDRVC